MYSRAHPNTSLMPNLNETVTYGSSVDLEDDGGPSFFSSALLPKIVLTFIFFHKHGSGLQDFYIFIIYCIHYTDERFFEGKATHDRV